MPKSITYSSRSKKLSKQMASPAKQQGSKAAALELREPESTYFVRNREVPEFFGQPLHKGEYVTSPANGTMPRLFYSHPHGQIWTGESIEWLKSLGTTSVDLV